MQGYFQKVIAQSALCNCVMTPQMQRKNVDLFLEGMGWDDRNLAEKLKNGDAEEMIKATRYQERVHQYHYPGIFEPGPVIDDLLPRRPLDAIKDGLVFIGEATADVHGQCSRCLKDLSGPLSVNFTVFMPLKASTAEEDERLGRGTSAQKDVNVDEDEGEDVYPLLEDGMYADLESLLRDAFADAMPQTPLCQPDCKGLCPLDGVNLNDHPEHHHEQEGDERWSALAALKAQLEAKED